MSRAAVFTSTFQEIQKMQPGITRLIVAGLIGTLAMTVVGLYIAPLMGMPAMNPAEMLAGQMGGITILGWMAHLMIGIVLAFAYGFIFLERLSGPPAARGAIFSLLPWLMAQVIVMPMMMGMPLFSGSMSLAVGSLIGHLVYGAVLGAVAGLGAAGREA
jgi:uncharacterized membrane protein YagU involved in acid resistance